MNDLATWLPRTLVVFATLVLLGLAGHAMRGTSQGPYDWHRFGTIPVSADGRIKPLDTVARTNLMILSGKQTIEIDGERQPAIRWIADVMGRNEMARHYPVIRIDHPDVRSLLGVEEYEGHHFTLMQIMPHWPQIVEQAQRAIDLPARQRNPFQRQILQLYRQVTIHMETSMMQSPYMIPPIHEDDEWAPFFRVMYDAQAAGEKHPVVEVITSIMSAYHQDQPQHFNEHVQAYQDMFERDMPAIARKAKFEVFFNRFTPFYHATSLYVITLLLAFGSFLMRSTGSAWPRALCQAAFGILVLTFILHTFGLVARMYLQGRPPVTNLYSSAVFVGWGTVLLALIVERIYKLGLGSMAAGAVGFVTLIIAHNLAGDRDTMEMMQAVLDSNFWLATHVITITIGYSATFLAGLLAIIFILAGVFTPLLTPERVQAITKMVYGTVCFALLFSFVGTVLGGIWADQSWGRFWGWDPKENGAAMIVLLHAIILHARWGGMIRARGMMVLAVGGNIVTAWAWFGTNMLGVGLHSYGFMDAAMFWLMAFVLSQIIIMAIGTMRPEAWRSNPQPTRHLPIHTATADHPA